MFSFSSFCTKQGEKGGHASTFDTRSSPFRIQIKDYIYERLVRNNNNMCAGHTETSEGVLTSEGHDWFRVTNAGIAVSLLGFVGDKILHSLGYGPRETLAAHVVMLIGGIITTVALFQLWRSSETNNRLIAGLGLFFGIIEIVGLTWDNTLHARGIELAPSAPPHVMGYGGMFVVIGLSVIVLRSN